MDMGAPMDGRALLDTRGKARGEIIASRVERNAKGMPRYMGQESAAKNEGQTEEGKSEARDGATDSPSLGRAPQGTYILHRGDDAPVDGQRSSDTHEGTPEVRLLGRA